jgi:hypothetical protein
MTGALEAIASMGGDQRVLRTDEVFDLRFLRK